MRPLMNKTNIASVLPKKWLQVTRRRLVAIAILGLIASVVTWFLWPSRPPFPILARWQLPGKEGYPLAFSPNGKLLVTGHPERGYFVWDLASKTVRTNGRTSSFGYDAVFSPDGNTLAVFTVQVPHTAIHIVVIDTFNGTIKTTLELDSSVVISPRFSLDGKHFKVVTYPTPPRAGPWTIRSWTINDWTEEPERVFTMPTKPAYLTADMSPTGGRWSSANLASLA